MKGIILIITLVLASSAVSAGIITNRATFLGQGGKITQYTNISADFTITSGPGASAFQHCFAFEFAKMPVLFMSDGALLVN
jgi:hypothetical protein